MGTPMDRQSFRSAHSQLQLWEVMMMIECPAARAARGAASSTNVTRRSISSAFSDMAFTISTETSAKFVKNALRVDRIQASSLSGKQARSCISMMSWRERTTLSRIKARKPAIPYQTGSGNDERIRSHSGIRSKGSRISKSAARLRKRWLRALWSCPGCRMPRQLTGTAAPRGAADRPHEPGGAAASERAAEGHHVDGIGLLVLVHRRD